MSTHKTLSTASSNTPTVKQRLVGLDLFRIIAMVAVILLHVDEGKSIEQLPTMWPTFTNFASFAVPFFLAASFYLAIGKRLKRPHKSFPFRVRLQRLLLPYVVWTTIYVLYKLARYTLLSNGTTLEKFLSDPISIIFLGGAGLHLYFLPLLLSGTFLIKLLPAQFFSKVKGRLAFGCFTLSWLLYEILLTTGNGFQHGPDVAFTSMFPAVSDSNSFLRVGFVYFAWMIQCLPYCLLAVSLHPLLSQRSTTHKSPSVVILAITGFIVINLVGHRLLPAGLLELLRGYSALILAISSSTYLSKKSHPIIVNMGISAFGIYLIHLIFIEMSQSIWIRLSPATADQPSIVSLLGVTGLIFLVSWAITYQLSRHRALARGLFAA